MPEHLVRAQLAREAAEQEEGDDNLDIGSIGPLLPGNEIIEELRHTSDAANEVRLFPQLYGYRLDN